MSAIHGAASKGLAEAVQKALSEGADPNEADAQGLTPLMTAAVMGQPAAIPVLLEAGADFDRQLHNGFTALMFAAVSGKTEAVQALLDGGASVDMQTFSGETALWFAADKGNSEVVAQLCEVGASVSVQSSKGSQPLHLCAFAKDAKGCAALLDAGADVHAGMADGTDALMCAAQQGARMVVEVLLAKGADPKRSNSNGATALMLAAMRGQVGVVERLLEVGAPVEARTPRGETAAFLAAQGDHLEVLQRLAARGADLAGPFVSGESCLHAACSNKTNQSVAWLVEQGASADAARPDGVTPLILVGAVGSAHAAQALLDAGAAVNHAMPDGTTALHMACERGALAVVEVLLAGGADATQADEAGRTPIDIALKRGHGDVAAALGHLGEVVAPPSLIADLRAGKGAIYGEALAWVKNQGAADPDVLDALLQGIAAVRPDFMVTDKVEETLRRWSHEPGQRDVVLAGLSEQVESALAAKDWQAVVERLNRLKSVVDRGLRVKDPQSGRTRYASHAGAVDAHVPRWMGWLEQLVQLGPNDTGSYFKPDSAAACTAYLISSAKTQLQQAHVLILRAVERFPGEDFSHGLRLVERLGEQLVLEALLPQLLSAAATIDDAKLERGAEYPMGDAGYAQVHRRMEHLKPAAVTAAHLDTYVDAAGLDKLALWLPVYAGQGEWAFDQLKNSPFVQGLVPWLYAQLGSSEELERFTSLGVRLGRLPAEASTRTLPTLPEALPSGWEELRALWTVLELDLDDFSMDDHVQAMVAAAMETVLQNTEPTWPQFDCDGMANSMQEWVEIHQSNVGEDYVVERYWRDARPHLPASRLVVLGRASTTDYYFVDPKVRTADDQVPVLIYLHEVPFGCRVVAPSLPAFLGHEIAEFWARREGAADAVRHLALPRDKDITLARRVP